MSKFRKFMSAIAVTSAFSLVFTSSVDAKQHVVKKGDTLYSIARNNGTTVAKIVQDNKIVNGVIKPGQVLNVGNAPVIQDAVNGQHKVAAGDTLYSIAKKNGLTLDELKKINNLSSNYVPVGRVLSVVKPVSTPKAATSTQAPVTNAVNGQHTIAKGDTLYSIAKKNGLTLDELKKINNLTSNYVPVGRVLSVVKPVPAPKAVETTTTKKVETSKVTTTQQTTKQTQAPKVVEATTTKKAETSKVTTTQGTTKQTQAPKVVEATTTKKAETKPVSVPKAVEATTTKKVETTKKEEAKPASTTTTKKVETTKKAEAKPKETTTTKKVANVPGATFKNKEDQELWNKVANNYKTDKSVAGLQPRVAQMKQFLGTKFDVKDFSLYRPGDNDGTGHGHGDGLALDLMVPVGGAKGDQISDYLVKNYDGLGIYYLIWKQKFYMNQNNIYGPANTWNWMPDRGSITQNHYDHVHISFKK